MFPERLAGVDVRKMHFNERDVARGQGVAQGNAGVGIGRRVEQDESNLVLDRLLHPVHEFVLSVALEEADAVAGGLGLAAQTLIDGVQGVAAVVLRLARTEQVQVGSVDDQQVSHSEYRRVRLPETGLAASCEFLL